MSAGGKPCWWTADGLFPAFTGSKAGEKDKKVAKKVVGRPRKNKEEDSVRERGKMDKSNKRTLPSDGTVEKGSSVKNERELQRLLLQEKQKNRFLEVEIYRMKKTIAAHQKTIKEKSLEVETKNKMINKLIEDNTNHDFPGDAIEDIDIDNLLHANLGDESLTTILSGTGGLEDLADVSFTNLETEEVSLPASSLADLAVNSSFVVDQQGSRRAVVDLMVSQKRGGGSPEKKKVSPITIAKTSRIGAGYQVKERRNSVSTSGGEHQEKERRNSVRTSRGELQVKGRTGSASRCLSCPQCGIQFPLGGQWKLDRHLATAHTGLKCSQCDKMMPYQSSLTAHMERHRRVNPWQCNSCDQTFQNIATFVKHVRRVHHVKQQETAKLMLTSPGPL